MSAIKRLFLSRKLTNFNQTMYPVLPPPWWTGLLPRPRVVLALVLWAFVIREVAGMVLPW